jgi:hypothetical protein
MSKIGIDANGQEVELASRFGRRAGVLGVVMALVLAGVILPASATTDATITSVFTGLQTLFTGSLVPAVVLFFAAKIGLVMATAWAGHIATSRKT